MPSNLPAVVLNETSRSLRVKGVGDASAATPSHRFDVEHILKAVYDETAQAIRVVHV